MKQFTINVDALATSMANIKIIYTEEMKLLVNHLKDARVAAGLTQTELATLLGKKTHSAIAKLEMGQVRVEFFELRRMCQILNVPFLDFVARLESALMSEGLSTRERPENERHNIDDSHDSE